MFRFRTSNCLVAALVAGLTGWGAGSIARGQGDPWDVGEDERAEPYRHERDDRDEHEGRLRGYRPIPATAFDGTADVFALPLASPTRTPSSIQVAAVVRKNGGLIVTPGFGVPLMVGALAFDVRLPFDVRGDSAVGGRAIVDVTSTHRLGQDDWVPLDCSLGIVAPPLGGHGSHGIVRLGCQSGWRPVERSFWILSRFGTVLGLRSDQPASFSWSLGAGLERRSMQVAAELLFWTGRHGNPDGARHDGFAASALALTFGGRLGPLDFTIGPRIAIGDDAAMELGAYGVHVGIRTFSWGRRARD